MKFSAERFKKLFSFASKREKVSLIDEAGSPREKNVPEVEEVIEKPSLGKRLMGLFKRKKTDLPDESESAGQDETQAVPEKKVRSGIGAAAPGDESRNDGEEVEALPRPGVFARLMGVFKRRKTDLSGESKSAGQDDAQAAPEKKVRSGIGAVAKDSSDGGEVEVLPKPGIFARLGRIFRLRKKGAEAEAGEADAGQVAEKKGDEQPGTEEAPKKSLWARLSGVFKRKSSDQSAADLADAGELFSWGEGEAGATVAGRPAKIEKGKKDENVQKDEKAKKDGEVDSKNADKKDSDEGEEARPPGFGTRVGALIRKKKVWIPLLLLIIGVVVFAVSLTLYQLRTREHARMLVLEKKNKQLQEENKKLRPLIKKQTIVKSSKAPIEPSQNNQAVGGSGVSAGKDSSDDCTVKDKASAAEVLKRCIDNFNATSQH